MLIKLPTEEFIDSPENAVKIITAIIAQGDKLDREREQFYVIGLNPKNKIRFIELSTIGSINQATPYPREVLRRSLVEGAVSIIIAHNHPSGDPDPSPEDNVFTKTLEKCCKMFDISLIDHIIVTDTSKYYSYSESHTL